MIVKRVVAVQVLLAAFLAARAAERRQRRDAGVVSIEYLVLGAALIVLIAVVGSASEVQTALKNAFMNLFQKAGK
jgi:hypothetical protein